MFNIYKMSTIDNYNQNYQLYILYYCNFVNGDTKVYNDMQLTDVCTVMYNPITNNFEMSNWLIAAYPQPTIDSLLVYSLSTVSVWYDKFYTKPRQISTSQFTQVSTALLSEIRLQPSMIGMCIFDTTVQMIKYYNGTAWVLTNIYPSVNPSCISIGSSDIVSVAFSANTVKLINITNFTVSLPGNNFAFDSTTGKCTYTGISRPFRVTVQYSYSALAIAATMINYISKNGSLTLSNVRSVIGFLLLGQLVTLNSFISNNMLLSSGDTVQLAGSLTSSNSVNYQAVSYCIEEI